MFAYIPMVEVFIIYFFSFSTIIMYHSGDVRLPIYEEGQREYTVEELVALLFNPVCTKVCTVQPIAVYHNYSFLVNLKCVNDVSDLRADDCGVWKHKGVRKTYVVVNDSKTVIFHKREQCPNLDDLPQGYLYLLTRVYHDLQVSPDFKRMIATLTG